MSNDTTKPISRAERKRRSRRWTLVWGLMGFSVFLILSVLFLIIYASSKPTAVPLVGSYITLIIVIGGASMGGVVGVLGFDSAKKPKQQVTVDER